MPFKDCANNPEPLCEYTPKRAGYLGESLISAIVDTLPHLRAYYPFHEEVMAIQSTPLPGPRPILFGYWRSSSAWRVRIALNLKGVSYDQVSVHLAQAQQHADWYVDGLNPQHQVPTLLLPDGRRLSQSMAIMDWLEQTYPEPSLYPKDAFMAAKATLIAQIPNSFIQPLQNLSTLKAVEKHGCSRPDWARPMITKGLTEIERELQSTAGLFCVGDKISIADVNLMPQMYGARRFGVDMSAFPTILEVEARLKEVAAFAAADADAQPDAT